jgi:outer membrane protein assembly factor BamB
VVKRLLLSLFLVLGGCAGLFGTDRPLLPPAEIHRDTVWQGRILIDGTVKVFKGATLTILPGTEVAFVRRDLDRDGLGDGTLVVEGSLKALGSRLQPILFRSASADPRPGDWLELRVDFSRDVHLRYCQIRDSAYTLHAHFTRGLVEDCTIRNNIDGCRLGQATFIIRNSLIENNQGKGINFRNSEVEVTGNIIRNNGSGIFLFETDRTPSIHGNNIYGNRENFRLGDFFTGDVRLSGNWWGTADAEGAAATIYDRRRDPSIGKVFLEPASAWIPLSGPREALGISEAWRFATGGYVDASPAVSGDLLYLASWDGRIVALDAKGGQRWSKDLGEVVDAAPAVAGDTLYCQSWGRQVYALNRHDGALLWQFGYGPSPADDHRQGAPLPVADLLLLPAWNGTLFALEAASGEVRWQYKGTSPLRAVPVFDGDRLYLSGGDGTFSALALDGTLLWSVHLEAPLLAPAALTPAGPVVTTRSGTLVAFDRSGNERWRKELQEPCYYGAPLYSAGSLFLGTAGGTLWKFDAASGAPVWSLGTGASIYATPLLIDGRVFIGDNSGSLLVVGADSGDLLASFRAEGEIQGAPALFGKRIVVGSRDHNLYALDLIEMPLESQP